MYKIYNLIFSMLINFFLFLINIYFNVSGNFCVCNNKKDDNSSFLFEFFLKFIDYTFFFFCFFLKVSTGVCIFVCWLYLFFLFGNLIRLLYNIVLLFLNKLYKFITYFFK